MIPVESWRRDRTLRAEFIALVTIAGLAGCVSAPRSEPLSDLERNAIYDRVGQEFERACFLKPDETSLEELQAILPPLIVWEDYRESPDASGRQASRILTAHRTDADESRNDRPVLYYLYAAEDSTDRSCDAVCTYLWRVDSDASDSESAGIELSGVRLYLAPDGFPFAWEILHWPPERASVWFVSESVEDAARAAFGSPLPGRRFCIEPPLPTYGHVIVARILSDGPVPMGPFIYCTSDGVITTVTCRCMPSQVRQFAATVGYKVEPLDALFRCSLPNATHDWIADMIYRKTGRWLQGESELRWPVEAGRE